MTADIFSELGSSQWCTRIYFNIAIHHLAANEVHRWIITLTMTKMMSLTMKPTGFLFKFVVSRKYPLIRKFIIVAQIYTLVCFHMCINLTLILCQPLHAPFRGMRTKRMHEFSTQKKHSNINASANGQG